jgi:hypothetical protein
LISQSGAYAALGACLCGQFRDLLTHASICASAFAPKEAVVVTTPQDLQLSTFEPHLTEPFSIYLGDQYLLKVELVQAELSPWAHADATRPFSLVFRGPPEPLLPQQIYRLEGEGLESPLDLFLVPVGPDAEGMRYEAVFN